MKFLSAATVALLVLNGFALVAHAQANQPVPNGPEKAQSAWKFSNSVGVNIHLHFNDTPYAKFDELVLPKLLESGIRHVRDGAVNSSWQPYFDHHQGLAKAGIKCNYVCDPRGIAPEKISEFAKKVGDVESLEGPNEIDNRNWNDWMGIAYDYQKRLYKTVKADPTLKNLPVLGQAMIRNDHFVNLAAYRPEAGAPPFTSFVDLGNMHAYAAGRPIVQHIKRNLEIAGSMYGDIPIIPTEAGYHNAVKTTSGHKPVSEAASGKYIPRLLLEYFNLGLRRTYLYEFVESFDEKSKATDVDQKFGLLRYDGTEKPAFIAVKNLLGLLKEDAEPPAAFAPGTLDYSINGAPASIHHTLLQKQNGDYYLMLWQDALVYDTDKRADVEVPPVPVTVSFKTAPASVSVYELASTKPLSTVTKTAKIDLSIPAEVRVLKITP